MRQVTAQLPAGYQFEQLGPDRFEDIKVVDTWAFFEVTNLADYPLETASFDWDRAWGVTAPGAPEGELAAFFGTHTFGHFPVPGNTLPMGGLAWLGVHPGHRRRGLLRAIIAAHFNDCLARGEALSGLTASEYPIYGRFGYGQAMDRVKVEIPKGASLREITGQPRLDVRFDLARKDKYLSTYLDLHHRAGTTPSAVNGLNRPGWFEREQESDQRHPWLDLPVWRGGAESLRVLLAENGGEPQGMALFRREAGIADGLATGTVSVQEVVAVNAAAYRTLWETLLNLDLTATVRTAVSLDDPLMLLLADRRLAKPKLIDHLWLRILDVPKALTGRQYQGDVDVVLEIQDPQLSANSGRWHLRATAFSNNATCEPTAADPDITLNTCELGAAYLGHQSLAAQALAGLIQVHHLEKLTQTAAAFGWPLQPAATWGF